ncbi:protein eva-1 C-like protein, partial [Dinothrombium tinctorium]
TFQVHACDGEELKLECLQNTVISIYVAQYGRSGSNAHHLCPESTLKSTASTTSSTTRIQSSTKSSVINANVTSPAVKFNATKLNTNVSIESNCLTTEELRYSLLQKVEAACREQRICKIMTAPKSFGGIDPCPGVRKYAEVAYKCRPNTFYNKIVCEGSQLSLKCDKEFRIVIYSANFGSTRFGVPECPDLPENSNSQSSTPKEHLPRISEDCQVSYATETVMTSCHGKRLCSVRAEIDTFGNPNCNGKPRLHLKVVYTCLPKDILIDTLPGLKSNNEKEKERHEKNDSFVKSEEELDEKNDKTADNGFVGAPSYVPHQLEPSLSPTVYMSESYVKMKESSSTKPPNISERTMITDIVTVEKIDEHENCSHIVSPEKAIGFVSNWISTYKFIK